MSSDTFPYGKRLLDGCMLHNRLVLMASFAWLTPLALFGDDQIVA
jgi:hypothetical protein